MSRNEFKRNDPHNDALLAGDLYSPEQFRDVLARERQLADRFGGSFSLLSFRAQWNRRDTPTVDHLFKVLKRNLQFSDEIGWLDGRRRQIGVIMHRTPAAEAHSVALRICRTFPDGLPPPSCAVFHYPTDHYLRQEPAGSACLAQDTTGEGDVAAHGDGPIEPMEPLFTVPNPWWKRSVDILASGVALVLLSPLLLLVAVAVKATSQGPDFFWQSRRGKGGRAFQIVKFRSMSVDAEEKQRWLMMFNEQDGPAFKLRRDPRVTPLGRVLRKTNLDELPQLWNVLVGDMSLVGPRPLPCHEADQCAVWQRRRLDVTPGMTCIWQIAGARDSFDDWMRLDLEYIRRQSCWFDLALILKTVPVFLGHRAEFKKTKKKCPEPTS